MNVKLQVLTALISLLVLAGIGILVYVFTLGSKTKYAPTVELKNGLVRGIVQQVDNGEIFLYTGIKYGKANRFEKAVPAEPWDGVFEATRPTVNCPQLGLEIPSKGYLSFEYSEDCLLLNVWRPTTQKANRTVLFYIYGGGFKTGSIFKLTHDARYIAYRGDSIVVMPNYRLGAFEFLYGGDDIAPANLEFYDQLLALKWVQENIHQFGGNPNSVTIFGNSAGSIAVGAHLLSPLSKGLFHRAIIQSGVPNQLKHKVSLLEHTKSLAKAVECDNNETTSQIVQCIKTKSVEQILNATRDLGDPFWPGYDDHFIPMRPIDALKTGNFNGDVDLLYGLVANEGVATVADKYPELNNNSMVLTIESTKQYIVQMIGDQELGLEAAEFYINLANLSDSSTFFELRDIISRAYGEFSMDCNVILFGEQFTKFMAPTRQNYAWRLLRAAETHIAGICNSADWVGSCHADELYWLMTIPKQTKKEDIELSYQIIAKWNTFATRGSPGPMGTVEWIEAMTTGSTSYMGLDYTSTMVQNGYFKTTCQDFWKQRIFV